MLQIRPDRLVLDWYVSNESSVVEKKDVTNRAIKKDVTNREIYFFSTQLDAATTLLSFDTYTEPEVTTEHRNLYYIVLANSLVL